MIEPLTGELVDQLNAPGIEPPIVRAAMAHLNLTMIHPFKDGNGRAARALQTLVIARGGLLHPAFCSIEEWLGEHTEAYYAVLAEVGQGQWSPEKQREAVASLLPHRAFPAGRRHDPAQRGGGAVFGGVEKLIAAHRLPERAWCALFDAALGIAVTNARYRKDADITDFTASRDLKRMSEAGLLDPRGEKRARHLRRCGAARGIATAKSNSAPARRSLRGRQARTGGARRSGRGSVASRLTLWNSQSAGIL